MNKRPCTLLTALGVVLFGLWTTGCTITNYNTKPEEADGKALMVFTVDGRHYHYLSDRWSLDPEGNIVGTRYECDLDSTLRMKRGEPQLHNEMRVVAILSDTLRASQISSIWSDEFDPVLYWAIPLALAGLAGLIALAVGAGEFGKAYGN